MMDTHYPLIYVFHFYLYGVAAIASALAFVTRKSPVAAALWLVNTMFSLSALFVMLDAQFIGVMQVLVYAGAIMVVFLFVVILLSEVWVLSRTQLNAKLTLPAGANDETMAKLGAVGSVAKPLFNDYLLAFELTSVLLLIAIAGAVILGRRHSTDRKST